MNEIIKIADFLIQAYLHIWPYLLITIPTAVAVNLSGASKYVKKAFDSGPIAAIFLATLVGAFSPFCSCGVIPVIAALLMSGVPLAPVMSFWIASPSMDPEIFFLSVGTLGWDLAVWRLAGTLALSLSAGFITYFLEKRGWIPKAVLKNTRASEKFMGLFSFPDLKDKLTGSLKRLVAFKPKELAPAMACCGSEAVLKNETVSSAVQGNRM